MARANATSSKAGPEKITIRQIRVDAPWGWLTAGWADLWRRPAYSFGYGLVFAAIAFVMLGLLIRVELASLILALACGFVILGPLLAVGLYEMSRRYQKGEDFTWRDIALVGVKAPLQLAYVGVALMLLYLFWIRIATLLFALFQGTMGMPPLDQFLTQLLLTDRGVAFLSLGSAIGLVLGFMVFAISAISVPVLLARRVDAMTAIIASLEAVARNFKPMLLWAALITLLMIVGVLTLFLGLIVTFPLVGHATWHAYRALVED